MAQTRALPLETNTHNRRNTPHTPDVMCFYICCSAEIMTIGQIYMIKWVTHLYAKMDLIQAIIQEDAGKMVSNLIKWPIKSL